MTEGTIQFVHHCVNIVVMKRIIYTLTLLVATTQPATSNVTSNDTVTDSYTEQLKAYKQWYLKLDKQLLKRKNVLLQLRAITSQAAMVSQSSQPDEVFLQALGTILKNKDHLSSHELLKLHRTCLFTNLKSVCSNHDLNEQLIAADPNNFYSHLPMLNQAYQTADHNRIDAVIDEMANTQYAKRYYGHELNEIKQVVDKYLQNNPIPEEDMEFFAREISRMINDNPDPVALAQLIEENAHRNQVNLTVLNYLMSGYVGDPLKPIIATCSSLLYEVPCMHIADTLITTADSIDMTHIGHTIKFNILANNEDLSLTAADFSLAKQEKSFNCMFRNTATASSMLFPTYFDTFINTIKTKGEASAFLEATTELNKELLELGVIKESKLDQCKHIQTMTNDEFLLQYGDNDPYIQKYLVKKEQ